MKVVDINEYKERKKEEKARSEMKHLIDELDRISDYVYEHYDNTRQAGYENFKKLLKRVDEKYDKKD